MIRRLSLIAVLLSTPALATGVPEVDATQIVGLTDMINRVTRKTEQLRQNNTKQQQRVLNYGEQVVALQSTIDMLRGTGGGNISNLESASGFEAASVYAIDDNNPHADRLFGGTRETIEMMIAQTAKKYGDDPALAAIGINPVEFRCWFQALVKQESAFSIGARSPKAAFGLTQIIPGTAQDLGIYPEYYEDPHLQLEGGARYLLQQVKKYKSMPLALAAYNAGPGAVDKYGGVPPFAETQDYIVRISGFYNTYAAKITGAEQVGTLTAQDMAIAETSNIADAAMLYAGSSQDILIQSLTRLQDILREIPKTGSAKEAMDLNSYAKAEVARMSAILTRLVAAKRKAEWAQYGRLFAAYARDDEYFTGVSQ